MDFYSSPYWIVMLALTAGAVTAACGVHALVRRLVPFGDLVDHNEVAGFMIAVVGVLYAVLMAFVVVVVWQQYNDADVNYGSEVSALADVHAFARSLPLRDARSLQSTVHRYLHVMVVDEWPAMRAGEASPLATQTLASMLIAVQNVRPQDDVERDARSHLLVSVQRLFDLRNRRLSDNAETLPQVLWTVLVAGAAITVGFGFLFGVGRFPIQLIMTGCVAALIALTFSLLIELDYPFRRDMALSPQRWVDLERFLDIRGEDAFRAPPATAARRARAA